MIGWFVYILCGKARYKPTTILIYFITTRSIVKYLHFRSDIRTAIIYLGNNICFIQYEAIPESLKNMLLVMDSAGVFSTAEGYSPLWDLTWDRIGAFLPTLKQEVFKTHQPGVVFYLFFKEHLNVSLIICFIRPFYTESNW